jgi:phage terminase large subunit GpA-like protein
VKVRQRNEALDCRVYAMAALELMGLNIEHLAKHTQNEVKSDQVVPKRRAFKPRPNNFVTGY